MMAMITPGRGALGYEILLPVLDGIDDAYELGKEMYRVDEVLGTRWSMLRMSPMRRGNSWRSWLPVKGCPGMTCMTGSWPGSNSSVTTVSNSDRSGPQQFYW